MTTTFPAWSWMRRAACALAVAAVAAVPGQAEAAASDWQETAEGKLRLISAAGSVGTDAALRLGLEFQMAEDWKIYWRSPGDAGYPPEIDWSESQNLAEAEMRWPVPHRFELFGMQTFGYGDHIVLPIDARAEDASEPVKLRGRVDYLTCREICIPHSLDVALDIPAQADAGGGSDGAAANGSAANGSAANGSAANVAAANVAAANGATDHAFTIDRFRALVPGEGAGAGLELERAEVRRGGEAPEIEIAFTSDIALESPDAIVEHAEGVRFGKPDVRLGDGGRHAVLTLPGERDRGEPVALAGQTVTLTVFDGQRGLERQVTLQEAAAASGLAAMLPAWLGGAGGGTGVGAGEFATILGLAVIGGLILNLMPCVLPVLSLKLMSVVGTGGKSRGYVRASFLASAAGILFSFLVLAAGAIALKATGTAVGWGMQFQQPLFLVALTLVVTLFACNLFGFFEVPLPRFLADAAGGGQREGMAGHFMTGTFATILATPCSAPFLGTAIAFALSRGVLEILAIFLALGVGLALPYLAVAAAPGVARVMPRPGPWMVTLKKILGLALVATGVWLMSVLATQEGMLAAGLVTAAMAAMGALLWLRGRLDGTWRRALPGAAAAVTAVAFVMPATLGAPADEAARNAKVEMAGWEPLDKARIRAHVEDGKVVFVDVTADWCITCQVNKTRVLDADPVYSELKADGVVRMRGDWTSPDERISDYLAGFGRYGIPFNAVYGPESPDGVTLPELLTSSGVMDAMDKARNGEAG